jgi:hypothetical protein
MALTKKMERALYGPSLFEITCGTLLSVILGVLLAAGFLVFKPVEIVKDLPKPEDRKIGTVYYQQGSNDATKAKAWRNKRKQLLEGAPGEIAFAEEELNAWLNADSGSYTSGESSKQPAKAAAPAPKSAAAKSPAPAPEAAASADFFALAAPEVRIADTFQVGMTGTFNYAGSAFPVVVQARGGFEKQGDRFVYQPDTLYIGSLPIHAIPGALSWGVAKLSNWLSSSQAMPENALAVWKKVADVKVDGRQLKVVIQ